MPSLLTSVVRRALLLRGSLRECLYGREMVKLRQKQAGDRRREVNSPGARVWATRPAALWRSDMEAMWVNEEVRVSEASWFNVLEVSPLSRARHQQERVRFGREGDAARRSRLVCGAAARRK